MTEELIPRTILQQLGGYNRLRAMIGAYDFDLSPNAVSFKIKAGRKASYARVTLNGLDLYDVHVSRLRKGEEFGVQTFNNIYASELRYTLERATGLYLSL